MDGEVLEDGDARSLYTSVALLREIYIYVALIQRELHDTNATITVISHVSKLQ